MKNQDAETVTLSGGMKRRAWGAKARVHAPSILFLDERTAGVDMELRHAMWTMVGKLRESGVTAVLTTHYIDETEEMAGRMGMPMRGELILAKTRRY